MGEVTEMMLDGILCESCGVAIGDGVGYPRKCGHCQRQERAMAPQTAPEKVSCPHCKKRVKAAGLHDHIRAVHDALSGGRT